MVRALQIAAGPQSAAELHQRLRRTIPLSSLYRSLAMLEEAGLLSLHHGQGKVARYELAEWLSGHHHHLVCLECGAMGDFELEARAEEQLLDLVASAGRKAGYQVRGSQSRGRGALRELPMSRAVQLSMRPTRWAAIGERHRS